MWRVNKFSLTSQVWCKAQRHLTKSFQVFPLAAVAAGFQLLLLQLVQLPASTSSYWPRCWSPDRGRHARCCSAPKRFEQFSWNLQNIEIYLIIVSVFGPVDTIWPEKYIFLATFHCFNFCLKSGIFVWPNIEEEIQNRIRERDIFKIFFSSLWKGSKRLCGRRHDSSAHTKRGSEGGRHKQL